MNIYSTNKPNLTKNPEPFDYEPIIGLAVKVVFEGERFWVLIRSFSGNEIIGSVDNDLISSEFNYGDLISFNKDDVWDISGLHELNSV